MSIKKHKVGITQLDQTTITTNEVQRITKDKLILRLSQRIAIFMHKKMTRTLMISLIVFYTILVTIRISFDNELAKHYKALDITELFILTIFSIEIILKIVVVKKYYFRSWMNLVDIFILVTCFIVIIIDLIHTEAHSSSAFKLVQLLRIFRLFLMFRKVSDLKLNTALISSKSHSSVSVSTPSESVLLILQKFISFDWVTLNESLKSELIWCYEVIKSRKLYEVNIITENIENTEIARMGFVEEVNEGLIGTKSEGVAAHLIENLMVPDLENVEDWEFDLFEYEKKTGASPLEQLTIHFLTCFRLFDSLDVPASLFSNFIQEVSKGYLQSNFYHNALHAADVVQAYFYLLTKCQAQSICALTDFDVFTCIVSAAVHDFEHPGVNNQYLINSSDRLTIRYNDKSVLENHHLAASFELMIKHDIFRNWSKENYKKTRSKIINCVLATDFSRHFADISKFKGKLAGGKVEDDEGRGLCMDMMMHTCDVSNPSRPWPLAYQWADRVMNEFYLQGDRERELGLPISHLCDRYSVVISKSQVGFIDLFIEPTFSNLLIVLPKVQHNLDVLEGNRQKWLENKDC